METSSQMDSDDLEYPEWQKPVLEALLELDTEKLRARVTAAEMAILNRLEAIRPSSDHHAERLAMQDALASLRVLKRHPGLSE